MVLLCYDHHENVKQIEVNRDSGNSSENESDNETEEVKEGHRRDLAQNGGDDRTVADGALGWTGRCRPLVARHKWMISAIVIVGIAFLIYLVLS